MSPNPPKNPATASTDTHKVSDARSDRTGSSAGLTYAPPYDPSQEMDPNDAPVLKTKTPMRREDFEYFRRQMERKAMFGRAALLLVVFTLLLANIWLTRRSTSDIIMNINEDRLHQSDIDDQLQQHLTLIKQRLDVLEAQSQRLLLATGAEEPAPVEPAAPAPAPQEE